MKVLDVFEDASPRDKIISYLKKTRKDRIELTSIEVRYMEQLDYCDNIIRNNRTMRMSEYINMVMEKYGVSISTARSLILDAKYVHGSLSKPVKAYERQIMTEVLWELYERAKNAAEFKPAVSALELIAKINALDKEDEDAGDDGEAKHIILRPVFAPETLGVPNPDNIEELVAALRSRTKQLKQATETLPE